MGSAKNIGALFVRVYLLFIGILFLGIAFIMLNDLIFRAEDVLSHYRFFCMRALPAVIALFAAFLLLMLGLPWGNRRPKD